MSLNEPAESNQLRAALEHFVYDNAELERLEAILDDFNPFAALRWTRQELRHSAFLRWLLDPAETHGVGSYFLRAFLKRIAHRSVGPHSQSPTVIDIDSWELSAAVVTQEWQGIDVLIRDDTNAFVGVIENKVDSAEHSEQLQRYRRQVEHHFPHHRKLFGYLTPNGERASDDAYIPIGYDELLAVMDDMLRRRGDQLGPDVRSFLSHYVEMVRRHIVEDSEIQELCQVIYRKHRKALDVLFEHRPDRVSEMRDILVELIQKNDWLSPDHSTKSAVRFLPKSLDFIPRAGDGSWTRSKRLLLFEFENYDDHLSLKLVLGPGEQRLRDRIHGLISGNARVFNRAEEKLYPQWWSCHIERWLSSKQYEQLEIQDAKREIEQRFETFMRERLPKMSEVLGSLSQSPP